MSKFKLTCLVLCILAAGFFANTAFAKKVVVVSGIDKASVTKVGYNLIYGGIDEVFKAAGVTTVYQWVNVDSLPDAASKEAAGKVAIAKIRAEKPDAVIVVNDDCLRYVGLKIDDLPLIFTYVFGKPHTFGLPKTNITGVTRKSYAGDIWILAKKLLPGDVKTVGMMSKKSASMQGVRKYLFAGADKLEAYSGVKFTDMYLVDTFDEWAAAVKVLPQDFIYLADTSRITNGADVWTREQTVAWTVANSPKPVVAATERDCAAGALFSIVTSEKALGSSAAQVALKVLGGTAPKDIPYAQSKKGKLVVNIKTAQKYKLEIPYDILSSAEKIYE